MRKDDNEWEFSNHNNPNCYNLEINTVNYIISQDCAALTHALLLLVDAVNDKSFKCRCANTESQ